MTEQKPFKLSTVRWRLRKLDREMRMLMAERERTVRRCPHDWVYHPDPSGNNDSHYECAVCGRSVSRPPKQ